MTASALTYVPGTRLRLIAHRQGLSVPNNLCVSIVCIVIRPDLLCLNILLHILQGSRRGADLFTRNHGGIRTACAIDTLRACFDCCKPRCILHSATLATPLRLRTAPQAGCEVLEFQIAYACMLHASLNGMNSFQHRLLKSFCWRLPADMTEFAWIAAVLLSSIYAHAGGNCTSDRRDATPCKYLWKNASAGEKICHKHPMV